MVSTFEIPNKVAAGNEYQSWPDNTDIGIITAGFAGTGVVSGCAVTPGAAMAVNLAAGDGRSLTNVITVAAQVNIPVSAADASLPRRDLVMVGDDAIGYVVAGTPSIRPAKPDLPATGFAVAEILVLPGTTSIPANMITPKRVTVLDAPRFDGQLLQRSTISKMDVYGHSLAGGVGSSDAEGRSAIGHLRSMLGIYVRRLINGGAILHRGQTNALGDGGYAWIDQNEYAKDWPGTLLNVQANSGATSLTVVSSAGFAAGDLIHVGNGDPGAAGGEVVYVDTVPNGTTINLKTALTRTHLNAQPVFGVPAAYIKSTPLSFIWYTISSLAAAPVASTQVGIRARYTTALRRAWASIRCSDKYGDNHSSCIYAGSWAAPTNIRAINLGTSVKQATAVGASVEVPIPDNFPGGTADLFFVSVGTLTAPGQWTFTVDGVASAALDIYQNDDNTFALGHVKRFTGLSAGRHKIVATFASAGTGGGLHYFDGWGVEAAQPPLIVAPLFHRLPNDYVFFAPGANPWNNGPRNTTLTGLHGIGSTTINVASTSGVLAGTTITFEKGTGNAETREVQQINSATQLVITAATAIAHGGGTNVRTGIQDADITTMNAIQSALVAEFGERVLSLELDSLLNANPAYWSSDYGHFNDLGYQTMAKAWYQTIMLSQGLSPDLLADTAVPTSPPPTEFAFVSGAGLVLTNIPAGVTELATHAAVGLPAGCFRKVEDIRKETEFFVYVTLQATGNAGSKVWIEYSTDNQVTWKSLGRDANMVHDTLVARQRCGVPLDTGTGLTAMALPQPIPPDAIAAGTIWLRAMHDGGDAAADPVIRGLFIWFR